MNIIEVAAALGKPVSHIEQIARGYVKRGEMAPAPPTDFAIRDHYYACAVGDRHLAIHRRAVVGDDREIFVVARTLGTFPCRAEAQAAADAACAALASDRSPSLIEGAA